MNRKNQKINSIEKALTVLMAFTPHNHEMGTVALSKELGFHTSTVNRILSTLSKKGFLQQNPQTKKFTLGPTIFRLGSTIIQSLDGKLLNVALPYLGHLCESVGETVVLEVIAGKHAIVTYVAQGQRALRIAARIGERVPTHAAAGAKAIIAFSDQNDINTFLLKKMPRYTASTITDKQTFKRHLAKIRKQGVAFTEEEIDVGVNAIGAPIFNHENKPVAAVVVVGPAARVKCDIDSVTAAAVKKTASDISHRLLYSDTIAE